MIGLLLLDIDDFRTPSTATATGRDPAADREARQPICARRAPRGRRAARWARGVPAALPDRGAPACARTRRAHPRDRRATAFQTTVGESSDHRLRRRGDQSGIRFGRGRARRRGRRRAARGQRRRQIGTVVARRRRPHAEHCVASTASLARHEGPPERALITGSSMSPEGELVEGVGPKGFPAGRGSRTPSRG